MCPLAVMNDLSEDRRVEQNLAQFRYLGTTVQINISFRKELRTD
jgi:hypothetical protein